MVLGNVLLHETLESIGYRRPIIILSERTVADAVALMQSEQVGSVLVCEGDRLVGMLTERQILNLLAKDARRLQHRIDTVMVRDPDTVRTDESVASAVCKMQRQGRRRLPVVDSDKKPLGLLSMKRVIQHMAQQFPSAVYNLPPRPDQFSEEREGA